MNFLVYKNLKGDTIYINPNNFIRLVEFGGRKWIKYRWASSNYETEEIDSEYGVKIVQFKEEIGVI